MTNLMDIDFYSIPVSMLRQYSFCPRIPFLIMVRGLQPPRGQWVQQGIDFHERIEKLMKRRDLTRLGYKGPWSLKVEQPLYDASMGLHGICDGVVRTQSGMIFPLEIKLKHLNRTSPAENIQLCAYGLLLERKEEKHIERGFIFGNNNNVQFEVIFDQALRNQVINTAQLIRRDCANSLLPFSSASEAKCAQCEFLNFCADRL